MGNNIGRGNTMNIDVTEIIALFAQLAGPAFSVAFVFGFGAKLVHSFLSMGLDGRFKLWSLSARRAWIEIVVSACAPSANGVALRKESVDRNT